MASHALAGAATTMRQYFGEGEPAQVGAARGAEHWGTSYQQGSNFLPGDTLIIKNFMSFLRTCS